MTKELEALKTIKNFLGYNYCSVDLPNELKCVEKGLERLEQIDNAKPSEALERTSGEFIDGYPTGNINVGMTWEEHSAIKQALLELKAIKEAEPSEALECIEKLYKERAYTYDDKVNNKGNGWSEAIKHYDNIGRYLNTIKQALLCKQVEVSNSEALEFVDKMANYILLDDEYGFIDDEEKQAIIRDRDTIKQALITKSKKELACDEFNKYITDLYKHRNDYEKKMLYEFEIDNAVIRASTIEEIYNKFKEVMNDE